MAQDLPKGFCVRPNPTLHPAVANMEIELFDKRVTERLIRQGKITPAQLSEHLKALPDLSDRVQMVASDEELMRTDLTEKKKLKHAAMTEEDNED